MVEALVGFAAMLALTLLRIPIAFSMAVTGFAGLCYMRGVNPAMASAGAVIYETGLSYTLSVVPMFVLMGNFVTRAGMSKELYRAAYAFIGHFRGGLAMSTIVACGGFAAICGSSLATAATMSKVAMPSMREYGYSDGLASASIAAGGTLGILIPPSVMMVIYGVMTETNIGALFAAGVVPGIIAITGYLGAVSITTMRNPAAGPPGDRLSWRERIAAVRGIGTFLVVAAILAGAIFMGLLSADRAGVVGLVLVIVYALIFRGVMAVVALFVLVMGGIYGGVFTPTEAAGIGAASSFIFALVRGALSWRTLLEVLVDSASTTTMLFVILIGALIFANFLNFTTMPGELREFVTRFDIHPLLVYAAICCIYIVLGCVLEGLSMILLTVPLFFPLVTHLGADPVWFGIIVIMIVEISLITPPVGMNVFVLRTLLPDVTIGTIYRGVAPFIVADIVRLTILILFPALTLFLPRLFFG